MSGSRDWREVRIEAAIEGRNPTVLAELPAAYAVIGDVQFPPGYSLPLTKTPGIDRLSDLDRGRHSAQRPSASGSALELMTAERHSGTSW